MRAAWPLAAAALALVLLGCGQAEVSDGAYQDAPASDRTVFRTQDGATATGDAERASALDGTSRPEETGTSDAKAPDDGGPSTPPDTPPDGARLSLMPGVAGARLTSDTHTLWLTVPSQPVGALGNETHRLWIWSGPLRPN